MGFLLGIVWRAATIPRATRIPDASKCVQEIQGVCADPAGYKSRIGEGLSSSCQDSTVLPRDSNTVYALRVGYGVRGRMTKR